MFNKDRWNEILEALNANRFRTFLTVTVSFNKWFKKRCE